MVWERSRIDTGVDARIIGRNARRLRGVAGILGSIERRGLSGNAAVDEMNVLERDRAGMRSSVRPKAH
jgi:hypothetical protein